LWIDFVKIITVSRCDSLKAPMPRRRLPSADAAGVCSDLNVDCPENIPAAFIGGHGDIWLTLTVRDVMTTQEGSISADGAERTSAVVPIWIGGPSTSSRVEISPHACKSGRERCWGFAV
jgi:hypothetical protein